MKIEFNNWWKDTTWFDLISIRYDWHYPVGKYNKLIDIVILNFGIQIYW
jgi:hypothetical protein